ncbi:transcriptional regulator [Chryseobacterium sp. POL2]|uniref:transcriptional regulator n=1 Tax=Chryseobacterium sp. POL2 TaxID=2713414 RepID=UPI0013E0F406|nr:transcriptional regulator [Chryseobacterium sp. POL2]QIG89334.1 transcriptional regulator [Chryseobacterium sp. POL2]
MNYIRHLTGFYDKIQLDERLNPTHISLYLALFQFWNLNHFQNPISISRNEMMRLSKISAFGTYHKCIKELQNFGYIEYIPSFNPYKGSLVNLYNFENSDVKNLNKKHNKKQTTSEQALDQHHIKNDTSNRQALIPSINNTNISNNKTIVTPPESNSLFEQGFVIPNEEEQPNEESLSTNNHQPTTNFCPPHIPEIQMYFAEKEASLEEAEKFFNHYESNGWLVGGKSKMKNWQAAARNWLLNSKKFSSSSVIQSVEKNLTTTKNTNLNATTGKSYREPL